MAARFLLDTNVVIYARQRRPPEVLARLQRLRPGEAVLSVITFGELMYGAEKSRFRDLAMRQLAEFTSLLPVMPLPPKAGEVYGALRAALQVAGTIIGGNDLWIAAHAKAAELTLVTNNEREFRRVQGLKLQNWLN
jgi:tRNA(fMet)-specific endonuclease VapC